MIVGVGGAVAPVGGEVEVSTIIGSTVAAGVAPRLGLGGGSPLGRAGWHPARIDTRINEAKLPRTPAVNLEPSSITIV